MHSGRRFSAAPDATTRDSPRAGQMPASYVASFPELRASSAVSKFASLQARIGLLYLIVGDAHEQIAVNES